MSTNQREDIIASVVTLLDGIDKTNYRTKPFVTRGKEHWVNAVKFPILYVASDEPESVELIAYDTVQATLRIAILGRLEGTESDLDLLIEDVRKRLNVSTYSIDITEIKTAYDSLSSLKEFQATTMVTYFYNPGGA
jgi:hypothetical protein